MLRNRIIFIAIIILILTIPCVQVFATDEATQKDIEAITNSNSDIKSDIDSINEVTGQQVYDYYKAIKSESGKNAAVIAVCKLIEPILDEYVPFGLHKPTAYAQLLMESSFLSSDLSIVGNNPYGIKGTGYIGPTDEYID